MISLSASLFLIPHSSRLAALPALLHVFLCRAKKQKMCVSLHCAKDVCSTNLRLQICLNLQECGERSLGKRMRLLQPRPRRLQVTRSLTTILFSLFAPDASQSLCVLFSPSYAGCVARRVHIGVASLKATQFPETTRLRTDVYVHVALKRSDPSFDAHASVRRACVGHF